MQGVGGGVDWPPAAGNQQQAAQQLPSPAAAQPSPAQASPDQPRPAGSAPPGCWGTWAWAAPGPRPWSPRRCRAGWSAARSPPAAHRSFPSRPPPPICCAAARLPWRHSPAGRPASVQARQQGGGPLEQQPQQPPMCSQPGAHLLDGPDRDVGQELVAQVVGVPRVVVHKGLEPDWRVLGRHGVVPH
jgi:hypothetical protein